MSLYPRLFENPDEIKDENNVIITIYYLSKDKPMPFGFYKGKAYVIDGRTHHSLIKAHDILNDAFTKSSKDERDFLKYPGRLWKNLKLISFWVYPDVKDFKDVIDKLSEAIGENIYSPEWQVEVVVDKTTSKIVHPESSDWGGWAEKENTNTELIPVTEYEGSGKLSPEELATQHVVSPLLKKKVEVPYGYGSKHPDYMKKRQWQMASVGYESKEEIYPRLFKLNEVSASTINPFIAPKGKSLIFIDQTDNDIILGVDNINRDDLITKEYINSVPSPKLKSYLIDFLKDQEIDLENVNDKKITFGEFWDYQVNLFKTGESGTKKTKTTQEYYFSEENVKTLTNFYNKEGKKKQFEEFISNIPSGLIRQPLNELFTILSNIVVDKFSVLNAEIRGRKLSLNKSDQNQWKSDMIKYIYSFDTIDELNQGSFYSDQILKTGTFINTLFFVGEKGVGRGEIFITYLYKGAKAQGGGTAYDIILLNGKKYEVKEYITDKGGIRLGTEGKLTRFSFWRKIQNTVDIAENIFYEYEDKLKNSISNYFYRMWTYLIDDQKKGESYAKAVAAGVNAGEMNNTNLNILKMWYYLAHELVFKKDYEALDIPDEIIKDLRKIDYVNNPENLDEDLENASIKYFEQNPELNAFIIFRPNKVNIIEKEGFTFSTITQAAVKFLETELSRKSENYAKDAFLRWKTDVENTAKKIKDKEDKEALKDILSKTFKEDFYDKIQKEKMSEKVGKIEKIEFDKKLKYWTIRYNNMEKSIKKFKATETQQRRKAEWLNKNPKPELKENKIENIKNDFYPRLNEAKTLKIPKTSLVELIRKKYRI